MKDLKDMKRVLLKLSGEALAGDKKTGFDEATCADAARQVKTDIKTSFTSFLCISIFNTRISTDHCCYCVAADQNKSKIKLCCRSRRSSITYKP